MTKCWRLGRWMLATVILSGCGGGSKPAAQPEPAKSVAALQNVATPSEDDTDEATSNARVVPASAVRKTPNAAESSDEDSDLNLDTPEKDSPEWFILQMTRLKLRPLGDEVDAFAPSNERQAELRRERNEQLVDLATEAIARTHNDKSKQRVFDLAVHHLLEAELQLALSGHKDHVDALYEHASSLYERDAESKAAIEAGQVLIAFARLNAQRFGQQEPRWLEEYGRLARQFAQNFPQDERQAVPVLLAAGQSCDLHGLNAEAIQCYLTIREKFPDNAANERVTPILRRLNLKGKPLELSGPLIGGGFFNSEEMSGKPLLVVFWTTKAQPFVRHLPALQEWLGQVDPQRLNIVSVNLDDDDNESAVQTFLESNGLNWPTIFHSEPEKRGWNNPIATYYGIHSVPNYWVISAKGNVLEMSTTLGPIEPWLRKLMPTKSDSK